jgi:hypothetical protein
MKRSRFVLFHPLWLAAVLLAGLMLAMRLNSAQALPDSPMSPADVPGGIEGILREPGGAPSGGWIDIHDAEGQPWMGTDAGPVNGYFSIPNLPPGPYFLRAYPPEGSIYAASLPAEVQVLSGQWTPVALHLTEVGISGWVQDSDTGSRILGAAVVAHREDFEVWDTTNITGEFKIGGVTPDITYTLEVLPPHGSEYVQLPIHYTAVPITDSVVLEMHIPPTNVVGIVNDPDGNPVDGAWVVIWNDFYWDETSAELGNFLFRGLPPELLPGEFWVHAGPPWGEGGEGLISSEPFTIAVPTPPPSVSVVITLPYAYKTVTGHVYKMEMPPTGVADAEVRAWRLDGPGFAGTMVDPTGAFTMSLTGGEWHLGVEPATWPVEWIFPGPPAWVVFDKNTTPQTETVTLEVIPTNAWVTGRIVCPDGDPCNGDPPYEDIWPEDIWVELRSDEISNSAHPNGNYEFAIPIPDGWYELVVHLGADLLQGPEPIPVSVGPGGTSDVGDIVLLHKSARIMGQVRNQLGHGVEGVRVAGRQPDGVGWGWAETDASGVYTMSVIGGEWFVEPHPGPEMNFVFRGRPRLVHIAPGGTMAGVDFTLTWANARIEGIAVDANAPTSERLWGLDGWAWAERADTLEFFSDAPMRDGGFELKARGGYTYHVGVNLPPHAPFVSGGTDHPVEVLPAAHVPVTVSLEHKDAVIHGQLINAVDSTPALGIWGEVFGEDEDGHWGGVGVDPASAWYELAVVSGTWHLRAWVDPASGFVAVPTTTLVTAQSGSPPTRQDFEVWPIGTRINGTVLKPNGQPLTMTAFVFAEGKSPFIGYFETFAETDPTGNFELHVPAGTYAVGAALPGHELEIRHWLNPPPIENVTTSPITPVVSGLELRFRQLDGEIHGTVSFAPGIVATPTHPAYVWGWADTGEWAETEAVFGSSTAVYTLSVVSGTVWHVGAVYDDGDNGVFYESPEEDVDLRTTDQAIQNLELAGPYPLPQPIIVSFDASQMQTIVLPDGVELSIPPGALAISGTVTLFIFPTYEMRPEPGHELIGAGYEIWAVDQNGQEITQFNQNVMMTFYYPSDAVLQAHGISEHLLVPVYYSTLAGHWILADSYVVETVHNEITLQISHFSKFGLMSTGPAEHTIFLPLFFRDFGG